MKRFKTVDGYINGHESWEEALIKLRSLFKNSELTETVKWGSPVYTLNNKNVAGIGAFKSYVGIWFYQGVFLSDPHNLLINAQEGVTRGLRQIRFKSKEEIDTSIIEAYIQEAIQNQKEGKEIKVIRKKELQIPEELNQAFQNDSVLKANFDKFTPGKQREYAEYIMDAKRVETKLNRIKKISPMILEGIGLNDKYSRKNK